MCLNTILIYKLVILKIKNCSNSPKTPVSEDFFLLSLILHFLVCFAYIICCFFLSILNTHRINNQQSADFTITQLQFTKTGIFYAYPQGLQWVASRLGNFFTGSCQLLDGIHLLASDDLQVNFLGRNTARVDVSYAFYWSPISVYAFSFNIYFLSVVALIGLSVPVGARMSKESLLGSSQGHPGSITLPALYSLTEGSCHVHQLKRHGKNSKTNNSCQSGMYLIDVEMRGE